MLTTDLLVAKTKGKRVLPGYLPTGGDEARPHLTAARRAIEIYQAHIGQRRAQLDEALHDWIAGRPEFKLYRGFAKLLEDGSTFSGLPSEEAMDLRRRVFEAAARARAAGSFDRTAVLSEVAADLEKETDRIEQGLYGDLGANEILEEVSEDGAARVLQRAGFTAVLEPLLEAIVGDLRPLLAMLLGTVGVILLIACANVANLFLVKVEERSHELAIRGAMGAPRGRLVRDLVAESLALAATAGLLGLGFAAGALVLARRFGPQDLPRLEEVALGPREIAFTLFVSLLAGLLFGALPALKATTGSLLGALREGTRSTTVGRERHVLRNVLVTAQVALGLVLLIGSGLLVRTLLHLRQVDPGFDPESALAFTITLPEAEYPEPERRAQLVERALEGIEALPGVVSAGVAGYLPLSGRNSGSGYEIEGQPTGPDELPNLLMRTVTSPGFHETLRTPLLEGRLLSWDDSRQRLGNVVVGKSMARHFWPNESALGRRLRNGGGEAPWNTIVGVVDDIHYSALDEEPRFMIYQPMLGLEGTGEDFQGRASFVVRSQTEPTALLAAVRSELWSLDPNLPITEVRTLEEMVRDSRAQVSFTVLVLLLASGLALVLAVVGLYGVIAYIVGRRTHEIGLRVALGAQRSDVVRLVLGTGLVITLAGIGIGMALAVATSRLIQSQLFEVQALDPVTYALVPLALFFVALLASLLPAIRAARIEPAVALRDD